MQIRMADVTTKYASRSVLSEVTFEIQGGDFVGIIGPNGSGKSTLLKTMAGLLTPQQGVVEVAGRPLPEYTPKELALLLGVVPQKSGADFDFTVRELVAMGGYAAYRGYPEKIRASLDDQIFHALEEMDLLALSDRPVTQLSGGEWQRVLLARALAQNPKVLLLDEVTTHLDIKYKLDILEKVGELNRSFGLTVISVLHELELAAQFCSRLMLLDQGRVHSFGTPTEVLTPDNLQEVFGVEMQVAPGVNGGVRLINTKRRITRSNAKARPRVHIVGGGGSAVQLLRSLAEEGFPLSLGAVNREDGDWVAAVKLGIDLVEEIPFAPLSEAARKKNRRLMDDAQVIVVTDVPFGPGNVGNLADVLEMLPHKKVVLIDTPPISDRDFTEGKAEAFWSSLISKGAVAVPSVIELVNQVSREE